MTKPAPPNLRQLAPLLVVVGFLAVFGLRLAQIQLVPEKSRSDRPVPRWLRGWDRPWSERRTSAVAAAALLCTSVIGGGIWIARRRWGGR